MWGIWELSCEVFTATHETDTTTSITRPCSVGNVTLFIYKKLLTFNAQLDAFRHMFTSVKPSPR